MNTNLPRFIELHALQVLPASLANRDSNGNAKTVRLGGVERTRHSSQSWKRAIRLDMRDRALADTAYGVRTRLLPAEIAKHLTSTHGRSDTDAIIAARYLFVGLGLKMETKTATPDKGNPGRSKVLLYVSNDTPAQLAELINTNWDRIWPEAQATENNAQTGKEPEAKLPADLRKAFLAATDKTGAIDIGFFGRFIAEIPDAGASVDAAVQVAHAFTVDADRNSDDYFTAVDDIKTADRDNGETVDAGAGMLGYTPISTGILYRHAVIDTRILAANLPETTDINHVISEFITSFTFAFPGAKKNSTAAATVPAVVVAAGVDRPVNLATAFIRPVTPTPTRDSLAGAVDRLEAEYDAAHRPNTPLAAHHAAIWTGTADLGGFAGLPECETPAELAYHAIGHIEDAA